MLLSEIKKGSQKTMSFALLLAVLLLGACKQNDFYQKDALSAVGTDGNPTTPGTTVPPVITPPVVTPPVVVVPPVITPPVVVVPPVITPPVVVVPPVVTPPVVVVPPVVTPPIVVVPPVVTPPVVVVPPVTPPIIVPPAPEIKLVDKTDLFTQNLAKDGDVDILWMIDNSGSMADNQKALASNFSTFINHFLVKDVDFKMAITTSDGTYSQNGKMVGDANLLTTAAAKSNKAQFIKNFTTWAKVGTSGSGIEQGLKTTKSFLDRYASSFLRKDAFLVIVFVSDEQDQSSGKQEEYLAYYKTLKANAGLVKAYSIVTQSLKGYEIDETIGTRYNYVAQNTNGTIGDINSDFYQTLDNMGFTISNLADSFALNSLPYKNNIKVFVNGTELVNGWSFDFISKSIKFNADSIPMNGAKIEVKYQVQVI